jgi:ligand-binding sensor domain-containing protein
VLQTVAADASGELWAGAANGLFRVDRRWPSRPALEPVPLGGDLPPIQFIQFPLAATNTGVRAYFGTVDRVLLWSGEGDMRALMIPEAGPNRLHALHLGRDGRLWAGTTFGLFELSEASGDPAWIEKSLPVERARIAALTTDRRGRLWVGTASDGLYSIGPDGASKAWPWPADVTGGDPPRVFSLAEVDEGQIWVGQFGHGVFSLDTDRGQWRTMRHDRSSEGSLADDNVWSLFRDSRGLAWVGTSSGLQFSRPTQRRLLHVPLPANADEPMARTRAHGLWPSGQGVWAGSETGQLKFLGPGVPNPEQAALPALWAQGPAPGGKMELIASMGGDHWVLGSDGRTEHVVV